MSFFKNKNDDLKDLKITSENTVAQPTEPTDVTILFWIDTTTEP